MGASKGSTEMNSTEFNEITLARARQGKKTTLDLPFEISFITSVSEFLSVNSSPVVLNGVMALLLCTDGYIEGEIDGEIHRLKKYDAFVLTQSLYGKISDVSPDFKAIAVTYDLDYYFLHLDNMIDVNIQIQLAEYKNLSLPRKQFDELCIILKLMQKRIDYEENCDYSFLPPDRRQIRANIVKEMFTSAINVLACQLVETILVTLPPNPVRKGRKDEIVKNFMQLVHNNYQTNRELKFYADKLYLSPKYLSSLVKQRTHRSPSEWIDKRVIAHAKQLLGYSDASVKQIASALHFPDQSFFGKYFKHRVGLSPKDYRQMLKGF